MKLATLNSGETDGSLIVVSRDHQRYASAADIAPNLLTAIENWHTCAEPLAGLFDKLNEDESQGSHFALEHTMAPLPRTWQWLDGSAFPQHGELMQKAYNLPPIETDQPLMYQGLSDRFYGPFDDVPFVSEAGGIDFEGEFGIIVDDVPMGTSPQKALSHIKLIVMLNDWSLRALGVEEMKTGFGWVQGKPACSVAGVAITPDELGVAWENGQINLPLKVRWNDQDFGAAVGNQMEVGFHDLVAHASATRHLPAGTLIGSGTVSNREYDKVGSSCISERRAIDLIEFGEIRTPFMQFGDQIEMETTLPDGSPLFGVLRQQVVKHKA
jgi:fumarylacetoacetate (FAA) hydrolase